MGHISKSGQKSQSARWVGWVRLDIRVRRDKVSDGLNRKD